ncbi:unnamed protein product [Anisakis simplex]|uniref:Trifunctional enzyme subunit alpha, mitochondrial (inferred by orthology to a human protein) n=1 Tax=Anisakis simplex TaxID=6269 RepID=A0A0M3KJ75_ANISI|nr:unnamed protein product [Anisakis simplex]
MQIPDAFCIAEVKQTVNKFADSVTLTVKGDVAVVKIDKQGMKENTLSTSVSRELMQIFDRIEDDQSIRSVVLMSGKPNSFIAGADVGMILRV